MFKSNFKFCHSKKKGTGKFTIFNPHSSDATKIIDPKYSKRENPPDKYLGIASIDPGSTNLAVYIMYLWSDLKPESISFEKYNLNQEDQDSSEIGMERYNQAIKSFDKLLPILETCHYIIIESQVKINLQMIRMMQHLITYFSIKLKDKGCLPLILEFSPELKTRSLGGPIGKIPGKNKGQCKTLRKKFCKTKALEIMEKYQDPMKELLKKGKTDDLADTVCQAWAFILECQNYTWWKDFTDGTIKLTEA